MWVGGRFQKEKLGVSLACFFLSSVARSLGVWSVAWLIAHSNQCRLPPGARSLDQQRLSSARAPSRFVSSSTRIAPRPQLLLGCAVFFNSPIKPPRHHVGFRFRSGRTNQNKSFGQAESPIWPSPLRSKAFPITTQSPRHRAQSKEAAMPLPPLVLPCARLQGNFTSSSVHRAEWPPSYSSSNLLRFRLQALLPPIARPARRNSRRASCKRRRRLS